MQQSMEEDNISHISPYHVELLYSVLSEHITTDYVTTSVHTISNRKLSATYLTKRNAGNNVNPQVREKTLDGRKERDCVICSDRKRNIRKKSQTSCARCTRGLHAAGLNASQVDPKTTRPLLPRQVAH